MFLIFSPAQNTNSTIFILILEIIRWFLLLAHSEQAFLRLFCMEVFALLLQQGRVDALLLAVIFSQCSDASATVRAKALSILGDCIESRLQSVSELFDVIFGERAVEPQQEEDAEEPDILDLLQREEPVEISPTLLPPASALLDLLKERAMDDKVYVRKNALQLLLDISRRHRRYLNKDMLKLLGDSCRDVALVIRRHMTQMLTELVLDNPENEDVLLTWARSVLPLVLDGETRVQEKALECADELILKSLVGNNDHLGWVLLEIITEQGLGAYLSKAVELWARQQQIKPELLRTLRDTAGQRSRAALTFIAIIARHTPVEGSIKVGNSLRYTAKFQLTPSILYPVPEICFRLPSRPHWVQRIGHRILFASNLQVPRSCSIKYE